VAGVRDTGRGDMLGHFAHHLFEKWSGITDRAAKGQNWYRQISVAAQKLAIVDCILRESSIKLLPGHP
jgi:hypothetical protein